MVQRLLVIAYLGANLLPDSIANWAGVGIQTSFRMYPCKMHVVIFCFLQTMYHEKIRMLADLPEQTRQSRDC